MHSPNLIYDNVAKIRQMFPSCVTEQKEKDGKVCYAADFDLLRQELSDTLIKNVEFCTVNLAGKE